VLEDIIGTLGRQVVHGGGDKRNARRLRVSKNHRDPDELFFTSRFQPMRLFFTLPIQTEISDCASFGWIA
jgi:hypothetical protein